MKFGRRLFCCTLLPLLAVSLLSSTQVLADNAGRRGPNVLEIIALTNQFSGEFETLLAAVAATPDPDLVAAVLTSPDVTLFAPTNAAFAEQGLTPDNVASLGSQTLLRILAFHGTDRRVPPRELRSLSSLDVLNGTLDVDNSSKPTLLGPSFNSATDAAVQFVFPASNGFLYTIDQVLNPDAVTD